ncbi:hypothetical protein J3Q64DRAFT_1774321 [Phycomyces blakesleeanus]|uniref:Uncharacterized protein n=1 Tax=Phycomyces blakesleeanus TaxID=4837 RepID=A0ABR3AJG9_PHYBL
MEWGREIDKVRLRWLIIYICVCVCVCVSVPTSLFSFSLLCMSYLLVNLCQILYYVTLFIYSSLYPFDFYIQ